MFKKYFLFLALSGIMAIGANAFSDDAESSKQDSESTAVEVASEESEAPKPPTLFIVEETSAQIVPTEKKEVTEGSDKLKSAGNFEIGLVSNTKTGTEMTMLKGDVSLWINPNGKIRGKIRATAFPALAYTKAKDRLKDENSPVYHAVMDAAEAQIAAVAHQLGIPASAIPLPVAKIRQEVNRLVDEIVDKEALMDATLREAYIEADIGDITVAAGKINSVHHLESQQSLFMLSAPSVRVTASLARLMPAMGAIKLKVYATFFDSRGFGQINNPSGIATGYLDALFAARQPGQNLLRYSVNDSYEFGVMAELLGKWIASFGKRGQQSHYGILTYNKNLKKVDVTFQISREKYDQIFAIRPPVLTTLKAIAVRPITQRISLKNEFTYHNTNTTGFSRDYWTLSPGATVDIKRINNSDKVVYLDLMGGPSKVDGRGTSYSTQFGLGLRWGGGK